MHLKRQKAPKNWPIKRKGTAYVIRPESNLKKGIPLLVILRDILKIAQNRKEVKKALYEKNILVNGRYPKKEKAVVLLLDTLTIIPSNKNYRLTLSEKGKFDLEEIKKEVNYKIAKITNKKILKGKKVQFNLSDGRNFLSNMNCRINDSVLINLKEKKIEKCLPLEEKSNVLVFAGKHSGARGIIKKLDLKNKIAEIKTGKKEINVLIKQFMVIQ